MLKDRRNLLIAGGVGLIATALPRQAAAASLTDSEKANIKLVTSFLKGWEKSHYDAAKEFATYFTPDASIRMEEDKPAVQAAAAAAQMKAYLDTGMKLKAKIEEAFAHGPVVVTSRTDHVVVPGKPAQDYKVAGVFIVKKGKITEWTDYLAA